STQPSYSSFSTPISVSSGLSGTSTWNLGQTWSFSFPTPLPRLQNITVYVVSPTQLLYSAILPGQAFYTPPVVLQTWVSPANPSVGNAFTVYAIFGGTTTSLAPTIYLGAIPGLPATAQAMSAAGPVNEWSYLVASGLTTTNGTYPVVISGTNSQGLTGTGSLSISVLASSSSAPLTVAVSAVTAPPQMGAPDTLTAYVSYTGTRTNQPLTVTFWVNETAPIATNVYTGAGPSGLTISGVSVVTVYSQTKWTVPSTIGPTTFLITASASVGSSASEQGYLTYVPPLGLGAYFSSKPVANTATTPNAKLWLNTSAYGAGPFTFESASQSVGIWVNYTSNGTVAKTWSATTTTTISAGGSAAITAPSTWIPPKTGSFTFQETVVVYVPNVGLVIYKGPTFTA
ncbi:MAG TPA: hypothetical protein VMG81_05295, partial [Thermoplasmata archaeon]|nr:hypothetical protein [Thermoplasmata archaeon]